MKTVWGEALDANKVLQEYPRPQMVRTSYVNLNGVWDCAFTETAEQPDTFDQTILVPFSPECELSGVGRVLKPDEFLWYRRTFALPPEAGMRTLIHFGAVDQFASVWVNGENVGEHAGGYLPFALDITSALTEGENTLVVRVRDESDASYHSRGKQKTARGGIWYTPQSGIWQTVWCERVPETYIARLTVTPDYDGAAVEITVHSAADETCAVRFALAEYAGRTNAPIRVPVPDFTPWSPEQPHLYAFSASLGGDTVESYFAMRKFSMEQDDAGGPRLFLNGRPYFHTGELDQGYWSDGMYTAPSDEALIYDIELMKRMGFNMLRKHIKVEPLRWYYHCDRLGMLVWQDMINGGGQYKAWSISSPLFLGNAHSDGDYRYFAREDERGRAEYREELAGMMELLYNCPCIAMWVPFNEGWGQFDSRGIVTMMRLLDQTRTIDHASGWHDQGISDVKSYHVYFKPYRFRPDKRGRAVALTEFGGYTLHLPDHSFHAKAFGYRPYHEEEGLRKGFTRLYERQVIAAKAKGLAAAVYTQVSDVEDETNGFVTYDRKVVKMDVSAVAAINARLRDEV